MFPVAPSTHFARQAKMTKLGYPRLGRFGDARNTNTFKTSRSSCIVLLGTAVTSRATYGLEIHPARAELRLRNAGLRGVARSFNEASPFGFRFFRGAAGDVVVFRCSLAQADTSALLSRRMSSSGMFGDSRATRGLEIRRGGTLMPFRSRRSVFPVTAHILTPTRRF